MKDDRLYAVHILECVRRIQAYTAEGREAFLADQRTQDAVLRNLEVIGEAAKRISTQTRAAAPHVPWRRVAGLRDILIHQYEGVDLSAVWQIVERDVPDLARDIEALLADPTGTQGAGSRC